MQITAKHHEVEARFRDLVADADMPAPDAVDYEPESLVFYWHGPKLAVVVDFDDIEAAVLSPLVNAAGHDAPPPHVEGDQRDRWIRASSW